MSWYSAVAQFSSAGRPRRGGDDGALPLDSPSAAPLRPILSDSAWSQSPRHRPSRSAADRVYAGFDVSQPVGGPEELRGRDEEVSCLLSGVLHRRNHGLVSGPRGSGKTSLVRVFGQHADADGVVVLYAACDSGTSFGAVLRGYLEQIPASSIDPDEVDLFYDRVLGFGIDGTPHQATSILALIKYSQVVIVLDEFDRITDHDMYWKISSLLKLVSDARLPVRFVLVGGNFAFNDVVRGHPSLMRNLTLVSTAPLGREDICAVLDNCAGRGGVRFTDGAMDPIEEVACGSPYHARLFGMHAALQAVAEGEADISVDHTLAGLREAFEEWARLNQDDAATFREVCAGRDCAHYLALARQHAMRGAEEDFVGWSETAQQPRTARELDLAGLGGVIDLSSGRMSFRDATAPQFLLALHRATSGHRTQGEC